ncbi:MULTISPECIES: hypothetical protein [unclassified Streptomyces]|uniref:hypothetical protein n=1 Tax=unclassified Streptomyces TaxID=2593676 RepID=UPI0035DADC26
MPMIVDLSAPEVAAPVTATSPDGWLRATLDAANAGVVLTADYATAPDTTQNMVLNPTLGVDLSNTQTYGPSITRTRVTTDGKYGASCVQHVHTADSSAGTTWMTSTATAGTTVTVSLWVKVPATGITSGQLAWRNGAATVKTQAVAVPVPGTWVQLSGSYTLTTGQTVDRVGVSFVSTSGTTWWADACMAEVGSVVHPYVDGEQPGCVWDGVANASTSRRVTSTANPGAIRKVRIVRRNPDGSVVPVRSADTAWAVQGIGRAYDHEAPLGVPVSWTATPIYANGSTGPTSSVALVVPAPTTQDADVWLKHVDTPGLSARVVVTDWPTLSYGSRLDMESAVGNPFPAVSQDVYDGATSDMAIDAIGGNIERVRTMLLAGGVFLVQTGPDNHRPDMYVVFGDVEENLDDVPGGGRTFRVSVTEVARPDTVGQPLRLPGWSIDHVYERFTTLDAVTASYARVVDLATDGVG